MSFIDLYQRILAFCEASAISALHSETYVQIPEVPPGIRLNFTITPSPPYYATIIHRFSYGDILSGIFQVWGGQKGMTYHTGVITSDIIASGISTWLVVTQKDSLVFSLQNNDVVNRYFECYLWQINILTQSELEQIRKAVLRMTMGIDIEELVARLWVPTSPTPIAVRGVS